MRGVKVGLSTWRVCVDAQWVTRHCPKVVPVGRLCFMSACARQENVSCPANLPTAGSAQAMDLEVEPGGF